MNKFPRSGLTTLLFMHMHMLLLYGFCLLNLYRTGSAFQLQSPLLPATTTRLARPVALPTTNHPRIISERSWSTRTRTTCRHLTLTPIHGDILRTALGAAFAARVSLKGWRKKKSLNRAGALAAFAVATLSLGCSLRSGATLLFFYSSSSKLTRIGSHTKQTLEENYQVGGKRGASQVLACSLIGVAAAVARRLLVGPDTPLHLHLAKDASTTALLLLGNRLTLAFVAFFACCAGDTWASELGVLSKSNPRLVTRPWKTVAPGTNGGVSPVGLFASAAGGLAMGSVHGLLLPFQYSWQQRWQETILLAAVGFLGGLGGSLLDSVLGATIQITHYDPVEQIILKKPKEGSTKLGFSLLSNEMINVVSTAATALLAFVLAEPLLALLVR